MFFYIGLKEDKFWKQNIPNYPLDRRFHNFGFC